LSGKFLHGLTPAEKFICYINAENETVEKYSTADSDD